MGLFTNSTQLGRGGTAGTVTYNVSGVLGVPITGSNYRYVASVGELQFNNISVSGSHWALYTDGPTGSPTPVLEPSAV